MEEAVKRFEKRPPIVENDVRINLSKDGKYVIHKTIQIITDIKPIKYWETVMSGVGKSERKGPD